LSLNAKYYYLIGDRNQSIYGYSGANCSRIEGMLKSRRETVDKTLSVNFRSDKNIIENSNRFSSLRAVPNSKEDGFVKRYIIFQIEAEKDVNGNKRTLDLITVLNSHPEVVILARTNSVIKHLEFELLKIKYPMKYFNYITNSDFTEYKKGNIHVNLQERLDRLKPYFASEMDIFTFIEMNKTSSKFITSIHKSKGREFDYCVVVNSIDPQLIAEVGLDKVLSPRQLSRITFDLAEEEDLEPRNIHYVAVSRSKHGLYYMLYDF
jgi:superfamily I DNA/RNA helicase